LALTQADLPGSAARAWARLVSSVIWAISWMVAGILMGWDGSVVVIAGSRGTADLVVWVPLTEHAGQAPINSL
jgi:hypothetical protein